MMKPLVSLLILLPVVARGVVAPAADSDRPNILFFYVDDMGWGSIGPNGQADRRAENLPSVRTPNIDRLAAEGVNFTRGYGCTVCSPARSSLQTGFHQGHTFADRNDPDNAKKAIRKDDVSIGDVLSDAGYVTGYWGKWGYGGSKDRQAPEILNIQTLPTSHGYRHVLAELHHVRAHTFFQPTLWRAPASSGAKGGLELVPNSMARYQNAVRWPAYPALQNHPDYPLIGYCDDAYAFAALEFVREQAQNFNKTGQPFHGLLAVQIPHAPFGEISSLPDWDKAYMDDPHYADLADQTRQWAAMVTRIDAHFGNILDALEDPNTDGDTSDSVADNTLVIFQSDNGGPAGKNNVELDANGGLSGNKGKIEEGGIRVPLVMRWPARIHSESKLKAGSSTAMVVDVSDLLPTFCELAGVSPPVGIDGVSIAPTLSGTGHQRRRNFVIHEAGNGQSIIRGNHKLVRSKKGTLSLYDLAADPSENHDIAEQHSELVGELNALLLTERVTEPKGFANTYHDWVGSDQGLTSDAANWSKYTYANAGVKYLQDGGPPRNSWIAHITNQTQEHRAACVDSDLHVLGLEIRGNPQADARQIVLVGSGVQLDGRNEIRLSAGAELNLSGGTVSTLRWVDIKPGGSFSGFGQVNGIVYNAGNVSVMGAGKSGRNPLLLITGDYRQSSDASLRLAVNDNSMPALKVSGRAFLDGGLHLQFANDFKPTAGETFTILSADRVVGRFENTDAEVVTRDGTKLQVRYSESTVTLTVR